MYELEGTHISLDEAREELKKRWDDVELRKKIEDELGDNFWPEFKNMPRGMLGRALQSPDNGFVFFKQRSKYLNAIPLGNEYLGDVFVSVNEDKKGLGRLHVVLENGSKAVIDIIDFHANEKKLINDVILKTGKKLVDFHHELLEILGYGMETRDMTIWARGLGTAKDYYYYYLLHFVAHGVFFENAEAFDDDERGVSFMNNIAIPAIKKIENKFGLKPLIVRLYPNPETQTVDEDFFWCCYPPKINDYIINYARKNNFNFKEVNLDNS